MSTRCTQCPEPATHDLGWTGLHADAPVCAHHYTYPTPEEG